MVMSGRRWFTLVRPGRGQSDRRNLTTDGFPGKLALDPAQVSAPRRAGRPAAIAPPQRILFINQYYWPDHASTAQHLADLAESLAEKGHECHVLCSQSRYQPGEPRPPAYEVHAGVHIHRVPATSLGRRGTFARMADYLSFYAGAVVEALVLPRFDSVVTLTTPPIIGLIGTLLKTLRSSRHVYWSMDLHPDASIALGRMKPGRWFPRLMTWLSDTVYRRADSVVVLGPYMADRIALKGAPAARIATIPVWSRREEIYPIPRAANPLRKTLELGNRFVAMYSGNLGLAHTFEDFITAARHLRHRDDIVFLFVGGGPRLKEVALAQEVEGLTNIRLLDYFPRAELHASLSLADVHLISMRPEMTGIVVPGKLYGVMAAGRPAIFVGPQHCETADTIRDAEAGFTISPGNANELISAIEMLASDPEVARGMGARARAAFLMEYERTLCCRQWNDLVGNLAAKPISTRPVPVPSKVRPAMPVLITSGGGIAQ